MKRYAGYTLGLLMTALLLAGCGASAKNMSRDMAPAEAQADRSAMDDAMKEELGIETEMPQEEAAVDTGTGGNAGEAIQKSGRKLIRNVYMNVQTKEFDTFMEELNKQILELGGYVEQSNVSGNSYYHSGSRYASIRARIPSEKLTVFTDGVSEAGNVTNRNESVEDVTLNYVDVESHKKALEVEQERLLSLLQKAETVEDIIAIETRLSEVRYELESYGSQLRTYDNLVDYSTVQLEIYEVDREVQTEEKDAWSRIRNGLGESIYDIGRGLKEFGIGLVVNLPYIILWAAVVFVLYILGKIIYHKGLKKEKISLFRRKKRNEEEHKE